MIFNCEKSELSETLNNVSKAVADRSSMSILEEIRFVLNEGSLELTGYDLEIGIRTVVKTVSDDKGSFTANARLFSEMVRRMPSGTLTIELDDKKVITLSSGVTSYNLNAADDFEYPELPSKGDSEGIKLSQAVLKNMITQTKFAASILNIKPILKGELFDIDENMLTMAAIDGYRLAVRNEPIAFDGQLHFVILAKSLDEISKLLSDDEEESCTVYITRKHAVFEIGRYLVNARLLEGEFHPYKSAIPTECSTEVIADRQELITVLERCQLLINEKNPSPVRCVFEDGKIKIKCASAQLGRFYDEVDADVKGASLEIGFKCKYFTDPLKVISEDKVRLQLNGSLQPMKILPVTGNSYLYLVLPVRLPRDKS